MTSTPPPKLVRLGILGGTGRMGRWVEQLIAKDYADRFTLAVAVGSKDDPLALLKCEAVLDFSNSEAMASLANLSLDHTGPFPFFVVGSTGWTPDETSSLRALAEKTQVLVSSNFATGVLAFMEIVRTSAKLLSKLGYDPVLTETHHQHKKDAPSGTAIAIMKNIQATAPHLPLQIQSIRAGEVIGDHDLTFFGAADRLTIRHSAQDRSAFARGALDVVLWLSQNRSHFAVNGDLIGIDAYLKDLLK